MIKSFNPELNPDILRLKELHALKDKQAFKRLKHELMLKHGISKATIYRELKKDVPGSYRKPDYKPASRVITETEIAMVRELLVRKTPVMRIPDIIERECGTPCSWDRLDKIRAIIDSRADASGNKAVTIFASSFGDEIRQLCERAFKCDLMAPQSYVEFSLSGIKYHLTYNEVKDIILICSNSAARETEGFFDDTSYVRAKLWHLFYEKIRLIDDARQVTPRELIELKNNFEEFEQSFFIMFDEHLATITAVVGEIDPSVPYDRIVALMKKYSPKEKLVK